MAKIKIKTKGMHCSSCEMILKESIEELDGVSQAKASQTDGTVSVEFDKDKVDADRIKDIIRKEGYEVIE